MLTRLKKRFFKVRCIRKDEKNFAISIFIFFIKDFFFGFLTGKDLNDVIDKLPQKKARDSGFPSSDPLKNLKISVGTRL